MQKRIIGWNVSLPHVNSHLLGAPKGLGPRVLGMCSVVSIVQLGSCIPKLCPVRDPCGCLHTVMGQNADRRPEFLTCRVSLNVHKRPMNREGDYCHDASFLQRMTQKPREVK